MKMSHSPLLARVLAAGTLSAVALALAAPAQAAFNNREIPDSERSPAGTPGANHCAKIEIIYARGTVEPVGNSWALNGVETDPNLPDEYASTAIWNQITKDLGNTMVSVYKNGAWVDEREYVTKYTTAQTPWNTNAALWGRSDFALWNLPYPASPDFLTDTTTSNSVQDGTITLINHITAENARCPNKKYMLFGYSQGSLVVANAISVPNQRKYWYGSTYAPFLHSVAQDNIVSVGLLADAGYNSNDTINVGGRLEFDRTKHDTAPSAWINHTTTYFSVENGTRQDLNGRRNDGTAVPGTKGKLEAPGAGPSVGLRSSNPYLPTTIANSTGTLNKVRSYCIDQDPICNRASTNTEGHFYYFGDPVPRTNLAVFAVQKLRSRDPRWAPYAYTPFPGYSPFPAFASQDSTLIAP